MALAHRSRLEREIWLDDVEALHDGGLALSGQAHRLLGLTTLLIDLCESMAAKALDGLRAGEAVEEARREWESHLVARVEALTSSKLPRCFTSARHTRNLTDGRCRCEFQLCGRAEPGSAGHRRISHAFAEICGDTSSTALLSTCRKTPPEGLAAEVIVSEVAALVDWVGRDHSLQRPVPPKLSTAGES
jgi:hypothetical protein